MSGKIKIKQIDKKWFDKKTALKQELEDKMDEFAKHCGTDRAMGETPGNLEYCFRRKTI